MGIYRATIHWQRGEEENFLDMRYSRAHTWRFDGGIELPASSSPLVVPLPMSVESAVDPEEAFVASISSCHMLWFLSIAAKAGYVVESYTDAAYGTMKKDSQGKLAITTVILSPKTKFSAEKQPGLSELEAMHHAAHGSCFIANSVKTEILCNPFLE